MLGRGARHMAKAEVNTPRSAHQASSLVLPVCVYQSGLAACEVKPEHQFPAPCISFDFKSFSRGFKRPTCPHGSSKHAHRFGQKLTVSAKVHISNRCGACAILLSSGGRKKPGHMRCRRQRHLAACSDAGAMWLTAIEMAQIPCRNTAMTYALLQVEQLIVRTL
jgi:hypothetical protein